ncbi:hypothetical protein B0J14DRAFT_558309 [Halenospora varia]|nr:hypothetical protein B0J14DRAFT_558309 [Halenospora varia]
MDSIFLLLLRISQGILAATVLVLSSYVSSQVPKSPTSLKALGSILTSTRFLVAGSSIALLCLFYLTSFPRRRSSALRTRHYIHFGILCLMTLFFKAGFIALSITLSDTKSDSMRQYAVMGNVFASMGYLVCVAEALMCGIEITRMRNEGKEVKELLP